MHALGKRRCTRSERTAAACLPRGAPAVERDATEILGCRACKYLFWQRTNLQGHRVHGFQAFFFSGRKLLDDLVTIRESWPLVLAIR
jgi:hypothetical protein